MGAYTSPAKRSADAYFKVGAAEQAVRILLANPDLPMSARHTVQNLATLLEVDDPTEDGQP